MDGLRAVLLDAGGTLIHPDHAFILERLAEEGVEADRDDYERAKRQADAVVRDLLRSDDPGTDDTRIRVWFAALLTTLGLPEDRLDGMAEAIRARHADAALWTRPVPGTLQMLRRLAESGLRLAVISNADGRVERYLEAAGLAGEFELIVDSGVEGIEKPDPRIFQRTLERLDLGPHEVVYVGDSWEVDVVGARAAGIRPVYLSAEPRDGALCIARITELPAALGLETTR